MKIVIVSILAIAIMAMLPSISALEYDATVKANEDYITELISDGSINPEKAGIISCMIKFIMRLIIKMILLPIKIIKKVIRLVLMVSVKLFCLPFKIFAWIIDLITPFMARMTS